MADAYRTAKADGLKQKAMVQIQKVKNQHRELQSRIQKNQAQMEMHRPQPRIRSPELDTLHQVKDKKP